MKLVKFSVLLGLVAILSACSPEVGSDKWCANIKATATGDRTLEEVKDYSKHCLFK